MKWRVRKPGAKAKLQRYKRTRWHLWFAWYPVRVPTKGRMAKQHMVWLTKIYRLGTYHYQEGDSWWTWEYKEKL